MTNKEVSEQLMKILMKLTGKLENVAPDVTMEDMASGDKKQGIDQVMEYVTGWKSTFSDITSVVTNRIESGDTYRRMLGLVQAMVKSQCLTDQNTCNWKVSNN